MNYQLVVDEFGNSPFGVFEVIHPKSLDRFKVGDVVQLKAKYSDSKFYPIHGMEWPSFKYLVTAILDEYRSEKVVQIKSITSVMSPGGWQNRPREYFPEQEIISAYLEKA